MSSAEDAVSALQLLAAMYPMDGELELGDAAAAALSAANEGAEPSFTSPLEVVVGVPIEDDVDEPRRVDLVVTLPPSGGCRLAVRQPPFLPNSAYQTLADALPAPQDELSSDTIMAAIDAIRATAPALADEVAKEQLEKEGRRGSDDVVDDGPLERVWFWFPSLSTREKRKDLVNYAATYRLNGFVLSGKPALLCVEGGGRAVDRYMANIKSVSWGDIPSFQKKVSCAAGWQRRRGQR